MWTTNTWEYIYLIHGTIIYSSFFIFQQHQYDSTIMHFAYNNYRDIDKKSVNAVRLYLKVLFISDIATSNNVSVCTTYLHAYKQRHCKSMLQWLLQKHPGKKV